MERDPPDESLLRLEDQEQFFRFVRHHTQHPKPRAPLLLPHHPLPHPHPHPHSQMRLDWYKAIDRALLDNLGKYRKYDGGSIRDLLRVMRNKVSAKETRACLVNFQKLWRTECFVSFFVCLFVCLYIC
jgi:hypothetical protein